jgi:hypothetical protein
MNDDDDVVTVNANAMMMANDDDDVIVRMSDDVMKSCDDERTMVDAHVYILVC